MDVRTQFGNLLVRSERVASSFVMAINGAFFTIRGAGYTPSPSEIEHAKLNVSKARYVFVDGINDIFEGIYELAEYVGFENSHHIDALHQHLLSISNSLTHQANRSLTFGIRNQAVEILANRVHGAQGQLLQKQLRKLDLSAKDAAGQSWNDPIRVITSTVHDAAIFVFEQENSIVPT